jgi:hypothetical protein
LKKICGWEFSRLQAVFARERIVLNIFANLIVGKGGFSVLAVSEL